MNRSDVIYLVSQTRTKDAKGVFQTVEVKKLIFCSVKSITMQEFFQGGQAGLKPSLRFDIFKYDYDDQEYIEYKNDRYKVYRTYESQNDNLELYVQKDVRV